MRALIQRVKHARVEIDGNINGKIEQGLLVLLGITHDDRQEDINWLVRKISQLRIFNDEDDKMNLSIKDVQGEILVVSQFTLFAQVKKGNRPSYTRSAPPDIAIPLYEQFVKCMDEAFDGKLETGEFGAKMEVSLLNDGPVTIMMDSQMPGW